MVTLDELSDTNREWKVQYMDDDAVSPDAVTAGLPRMVCMRSRRLPETHNVPEVCISSHKYRVTMRLPCSCLRSSALSSSSSSSTIYAALSLRYASEGLEEVADYKHADCKNGIRGATDVALHKEPDNNNNNNNNNNCVYQTTERYQFAALSYSHKNRAFVLHISFRLHPDTSTSKPLLSIVSAPFKVLSQRSRKLQHKDSAAVPTPSHAPRHGGLHSSQRRNNGSSTRTFPTNTLDVEPDTMPAATNAVIQQETDMPLIWIAALHHRIQHTESTPSAASPSSLGLSPSPPSPSIPPHSQRSGDSSAVPPSPSSTSTTSLPHTPPDYNYYHFNSDDPIPSTSISATNKTSNKPSKRSRLVFENDLGQLKHDIEPLNKRQCINNMQEEQYNSPSSHSSSSEIAVVHFY